MGKKREKKLSSGKKTEFTVVREFAGHQSMKDAFEQLIERQAYENLHQTKSENISKAG